MIFNLDQVLLLKDAYRLESFISICLVYHKDAPLMSLKKTLCLAREIVIMLLLEWVL